MPGPHSFLDNLANLRLVVSVALEHIQVHRNEFLKTGTREEVRQAERLISNIRSLMEQLEKEFGALEIQQRRPM
jgi:hypothetical protein